MAGDAGPPPRGADETKSGAKKGGGLPVTLIVMVVVALVGLGAGVGLGTYVLGPKMQVPDTETEADAGTPPGEVEEHTFDGIIVNIESDLGTEFLVADVTLECIGKPALDLIQDNSARIRDALGALLSTRTYEDTRGVVGREQLQRAVKDKINGMLGSGTVTNVYFPVLTIQSM